MSEDLVKRLWSSDAASALTNEAARLIEGLQAELRASYLEALAVSDTNAELASRLSVSQARLSEAVKVLEEMVKWLNYLPAPYPDDSEMIMALTAKVEAFLATLGEENESHT